MHVNRASLFAFLLMGMSACGMPKDSVQLRNNEGSLKFTMDMHGVERVELCRLNHCSPAPDNEYKTERGLTIPVRDGVIHFEERPTMLCRYAPRDGRERLDCKERG